MIVHRIIDHDVIAHRKIGEIKCQEVFSPLFHETFRSFGHEGSVWSDDEAPCGRASETVGVSR